MVKKRVVVADVSQADFGVGERVTKRRAVDETYRYQHPNPLWHVVAGLVYWVLASPVAFVVSRMYGMRFVNRAAIRRTGGCYIYGNHTHWTDAIMPYLLAWPRRGYITAGPVAFSLPVARSIVPMVGGIPLNTTEVGRANFRAALDSMIQAGHPVAVLPEAHEWPYYNGIRDFPDHSFTYPVRSKAPVIGYVVTYRQRRWRKHRPPLLTITVGDPIYPAAWQDHPNPKGYLRDAVHTFMCDTVRENQSYGWIEYQVTAA
ncbi:MAG: 1-acyl-sn-glycerol-3-phosphate acyltransferase [Propionibacteriaceae bacterium]|jgi:1-acyl-sn-glycerol-3-phosphate acyltransferase|nr:1-acyl-sn-glycerol-3-phosphate acyltransferase [Propionibacteriaceae bacterium]